MFTIFMQFSAFLQPWTVLVHTILRGKNSAELSLKENVFSSPNSYIYIFESHLFRSTSHYFGIWGEKLREKGVEFLDRIFEVLIPDLSNFGMAGLVAECMFEFCDFYPIPRRGLRFEPFGVGKSRESRSY
uniref:Uncharacterized protein LOC104216389 n=1 Tax=Nicotiana sylvestris TaxID=4096 RepID=A0A1U7VII4_NICSY|nr:PREDICTED: uncharacterized protein LOC104216389 [Nicotiana sylvestris]